MKKAGGRTYFGWYIVVTGSLIVLLSFGLRMGIGPFMNPMSRDLRLSRTGLSVVVAIGMLVYGLGMPMAGYLIKRYSTRFVLLTGMVLACGSILWTIQSKGMASFLIAFGVLLSLGLSFMSNITLTPIISKWFVRQRGKALFYLATGSMAGIAVVTPIEALLIEAFGWQQTLLLFAGLIVCVVVPAALFVMRDEVPEGADGETRSSSVKNTAIPPNITWKDAVKTKAYWQIVIGLFVCGYGMNLMGSHAVPMLMDHHFEPMTASYGVGLIGLVAIFSSLFLASIADRYPRKNILFWVYFVRGMGILGLVFVETPWQLYFVAITGGLVWAGSIAMSAAILSDLYGVRLLGILNGWAYFVHQIGGAMSSFLGGWGYDTFGTHVVSFGSTAVLTVIASWVSLRLPDRIHFAQVSSTAPKAVQTGG